MVKTILGAKSTRYGMPPVKLNASRYVSALSASEDMLRGRVRRGEEVNGVSEEVWARLKYCCLL